MITPRDLFTNSKVNDNAKKEIIQLLKQAEKKQLIKNAVVTSVVAYIVTALVVGTALAFATALSIPAIIGITVGSALIVGGVTGVGKYTMSKPDTKMKENNLENLGPIKAPTV